MHAALNVQDLLAAELDQRAESGYDITAITEEISGLGGPDALGDGDAERLLDALDDTVRRPDWPYEEPDDLAEIKAAADWPQSDPSAMPVDDAYAAAVLRAWTGRVAGNMLGKPVENGDLWTPAAIRSFLTEQGAWPLADYFPGVADTGPGHPDYLPNSVETTRGRIHGSSRDDDVDYTILNLHILRHHGPGFRTEDVAGAWLTLLPFLQTYTAERAAMRNLINGVPVDRAASRRNPYREWIGAAIRADVFGYVRPGDPAGAAELAYTDAALSHVGNGVYGEMWCAALVAAAFTATSAAEALEASLTVVPRNSRLYQVIDETRGRHAKGLSWQETRDRIEADLGRYSWVHTINNAAVLTAGLLYGDGDFGSSIGLTVCGGWDTDSNGGTAGSVAGILADRIDGRWSDPLQDTVHSAVFGYDGCSISQLAAWTTEVAAAMRKSAEPVRRGASTGPDLW